MDRGKVTRVEFLVTVDRVEDGMAVLLLREHEELKILWPKAVLPKNAREGKVLRVTVEVDEGETRKAEKRIEALLRKLTGTTR